MPDKPQPSDVFTPRAPVGELMFIARRGDRLSQRFDEALNEVGGQIVLFGDTGVGKTSLVNYVGGLSVARIECHSAKSFPDLIRDAFGSLGVMRELSLIHTDQSSHTTDVSGDIGLGWVARLAGRTSTTRGSSTQREVEVVEQPLIDGLISAMAEAAKTILFFDNFENVRDDDVRSGVAELIIAMADRAGLAGNVKIVVAGIAEDAASLVRFSDAASRRTIPIHIGPMPNDEIQEIVTRGFGHLDLDIDPVHVGAVVTLSCGYPYVAHLLRLHLARAVIEFGLTGTTDAALDAAVGRAVDEFGLDLSARYEAAVEQTGEVRPRQRVLHALALGDERDYRFQDVVQAVRDKFSGSARPPSCGYLNVAIGQLCGPERGALLRKRTVSGTSMYSFVNPLARPFIRMVERDGRVPWGRAVPLLPP